ncbi:MAG: sigma-70 family RNA polymerase sigma factor, partial [Planctomyces sp.]
FQPARDRRIGISEPTPSQNFVARESWDRILADESEADRRVISLRLQGYTQQEIAEHLEISERTVRRTLHRLMKKIDTA